MLGRNIQDISTVDIEINQRIMHKKFAFAPASLFSFTNQFEINLKINLKKKHLSKFQTLSNLIFLKECIKVRIKFNIKDDTVWDANKFKCVVIITTF